MSFGAPGGLFDEASLSAERSQKGEEARFPTSDEHPRRSGRHTRPSSKGSSPAIGVIGRLTGRRSFARLHSAGRRRGHGPIRVISREAPDEVPRVAFAIPRSVGNAVTRNRIRRRIREILRQMCVGGDHLIRVQAPIDHWSHDKLSATMTDLLSSAPAHRARNGVTP